VGRQLLEKGRNLNKRLNAMRDVHVAVPISDSLHLAKNFRSRLLSYGLIIPTTNSVRPVNLTLMKSVLGVTPDLTDVSRLGKMRDIYPLSIFHV
jgi:hypothetical protein